MERETYGDTTMRVERVYDDANTYCGCVIHATNVLGERWAWTATAIDGADVRNVHGRAENRAAAVAAVIREAHALRADDDADTATDAGHVPYVLARTA